MAETDTVFLYDGSLAGFYSCVHTAIYEHVMPIAIQKDGSAQSLMFFRNNIITDNERALRVRNAIKTKLSIRTLELIENVFLASLESRELLLLRFILQCFEKGVSFTYQLTDALVAKLIKAEKHLKNEAHLMIGFIRFVDHSQTLVSFISPKNYILPLISEHFSDRYSEESFLICDKTNQVVLVHHQHHSQIVPLSVPLSLTLSEDELHFQTLWRRFYQTISIKERENHLCRKTHMPNRYWDNMLELKDEM